MKPTSHRPGQQSADRDSKSAESPFVAAPALSRRRAVVDLAKAAALFGAAASLGAGQAFAGSTKELESKERKSKR